MTNIASSPPPSSSSLSPEDIERLQDRFAELETDIDAFSTALSRLSDARRRLSSGTGIRVGSTQQRTAVVSNQKLFASTESSTTRPLLTVLLYPVLAFVSAGAAAALVSRRTRLQKVGRDRAY